MTASFVRVVGFKRISGEFTPGGRRVLARFDAEIAGLRLRWCSIIEDDADVRIAYPPMGKGVRIVSDDLRAEFQRKAMETLAHFEGHVATDAPKASHAPP